MKMSNRKKPFRQWHLLHLQPTLNLKLTKLLSRGVQSVLSFWCGIILYCRQYKGLYRSKNKHKLIAISEATDDSRMWNESPTYGLLKNRDWWLLAFNFTWTAYVWAQKAKSSWWYQMLFPCFGDIMTVLQLLTNLLVGDWLKRGSDWICDTWLCPLWMAV